MLKAVVAVLPIALVLGLSGAEAEDLLPVEGVVSAVRSHGECGNLRMMRAAAVADGIGEPEVASVPVQHGEEWSLPLDGRTITSIAPAPITYCGIPTDGTAITLSDGTTATVPGDARLDRIDGGTALFVAG